MCETSSGILVFVQVNKQETFVQKVFLFQNLQRDHGGALTTLGDQLDLAFFNVIQDPSCGFQDLLCSEDFLVV